ncbi:MAG: 4Fe-4S binding protein [Theionarchaea archaeon]|nr:4Fe-4S binding protein [Theionarchaea archaeon]
MISIYCGLCRQACPVGI